MGNGPHAEAEGEMPAEVGLPCVWQHELKQPRGEMHQEEHVSREEEWPKRTLTHFSTWGGRRKTSPQ